MTLDKDRVRNTATHDAASVFASMGYDNSFDLEVFKKNVQIEIRALDSESIEFDLVGVEAAFANSLRRILLAELPTVAIENVTILQNTGVLQDEYLAHRLGLVPLNIEPRDMDWVRDGHEVELNTRIQSVCFSLQAKCEEKDMPIYSGDLKWTPASDAERAAFDGKAPPKPLHDNILITRLAKGQEISLSCVAVLGTGKDHGKWSPVGTAWYRLLPKITIKEELTGEAAEALVKACPVGVFDMEDAVGKASSGKRKAVVKDPRKCTTCRQCIEHFPDKVVLQKVKNHFIFRIESIGQIKPEELFERALQELLRKCAHGVDVLRNPEPTPNLEI